MLYFLHVSKCAGSSFIALARQNLRLFVPNANGNPINLVTGERLKFWRWAPEEQHYFLSSDAWQLVANENQLGRTVDFFEDVTYVTILREPIDRLFSQWQFAVEKPSKDESLEERGRKFAHFLQSESGMNWRRNYLLATLTYQERQDPRRLELAKERLEQFDHVFLMDTLGEDIRVLAKHGWSNVDLPWRNTAAPGEASWSAARAALSGHPDLLKRLIETHAEDIELYDYARAMTQRRKSEPAKIEQRVALTRQMPESDNFEFVIICAYEAHLNGDEVRCRELLKQAETLPDAAEVNIRKNRNLTEFALRRFGAPERAVKEHRKMAREKKAARDSAATAPRELT
jgi:hypothetical protein